MFKVEFFLGQYHIIKGLCKKPKIDVILTPNFRGKNLYLSEHTKCTDSSLRTDELLFCTGPCRYKKNKSGQMDLLIPF